MQSIRNLSKTFILQHDQSDCGVACLASLIRFHGGEESLDNIRRESGTKKTGTTLLGLYQAAQNFGFEAGGLEAEGVENLTEISDPAILHVILNNRLQHFVVFYGFDGDEVIVGDPGTGIEKWTKEKLNEVWKSKALLKLTPGKKFRKIAQKTSKYHWIKKWVLEDFEILLAALFLGLLIAIFNLSTAIFTQKLIDVILPERDLEKLIIGISLFGILLIVKTGLSYIRGDFLLSQSRDFNNRMIRFFFGSMIKLPKSFFDSKKSGEMIARMNDTRRIQSTVSRLVGNLLIELLVLITSLTAIFIYGWQVGILVTCIIPIFFLLHYRFNKPIINKQKEVMAAYALNESNYIDTINGIAEVKTSTKQNLFSNITLAIYNKFQESIFNLGKVQVKFSVVAELATIGLMLSVIGYSSFLYFGEFLELGELIAILTLAGSIGPALVAITLFNIQIQEAKVAFDRMQEFTNIEAENEDGENIEEEDFSNLIVKNLSFNYPGSLDLLKDINLEIKKGEIRALLGESGEGKSTIIQLLQRFYSQNKGDIFLDEKRISEFNLESYRKVIATVSQDTKIFNNYLLFNIALSDDPADLERLVKWYEETGFSRYFNKFPQGFNTLLGEEGANISGGQKQLVGLARALYQDPQFLLLDESTSAMDRNMEKFIFSYLQKIKTNTGILMATHRMNLALDADYVYVLESGKIKDHGFPKDVIQRDNLLGDTYSDIMNSKALL